MARLFERIKQMLVNELGMDDKSIHPSASLIDDLNMDTDDLAEFFTFVEDKFSKPGSKFEIPDSDADGIVTVQDLIDYLQEAGIDD